MVQISGNPENFWQDLKRRKVIRVATVYAAAAFIILQLVDIIAKPLQLPDWTLTFMIVLLCVGFIIAVLLSWIYDITPTGVKKTKPAGHGLHKESVKQETSNTWRIFSYVSIVTIVALIVFNIITRGNLTEDRTGSEKSIAVLPFKSLSDDPEKQYLADGMMDALTLHLSKVKDLRVMSRTSVEQYRGTTKTASIIGRELGVAYLLEGSFQKSGDNVRLIVRLIKTGKEGHVWANDYDRNWNDIFSVQSQVAQTIVRELHSAISPEEKQLIEKPPTANLTAYDFYQRGKEEHSKYWIDYNNREALERADDLYQKALKYDSTFAQAYTGLASIYFDRHYWESYLSENILDSVLILCNNALSYDDQLSEAYTIRGDYFLEIEETDQAIGEYDKALKFNPNDPSAYWGKGMLYLYDDRVKAIDNLQKAISIYHGPLLPNKLRMIGNAYQETGFIEKAKYYFQEAFKLDKDSLANYWSLADLENDLGNFAKRLEFFKKINAIDSTWNNIQWWLGIEYMFRAKYKEALNYFKKTLESSKNLSDLNLFGSHRLAWAYWQNGYKKEAEYYFNEEINYCNRIIKLGRVRGNALRSYYDIASVYAFKGEKEKAYKYLRLLATMPVPELWWLVYLKNDPLFDNIRNEPEFHQIIREMEAKYQAEHERVGKWLEDQEMLK